MGILGGSCSCSCRGSGVVGSCRGRDFLFAFNSCLDYNFNSFKTPLSLRGDEMKKRLLALLGIFGLSGDSFDELVSKELANPSSKNDFMSINPSISELGQGEPTSDLGQELLADAAMYQELHYEV